MKKRQIKKKSSAKINIYKLKTNKKKHDIKEINKKLP